MAASAPAGSVPASALAPVRALAATCYVDWSDAEIRAEGPDGLEFLTVRALLSADFVGPAGLAALSAWIAGAFPGWSDAEISECLPEFVPARECLRRLSAPAAAPVPRSVVAACSAPPVRTAVDPAAPAVPASARLSAAGAARLLAMIAAARLRAASAPAGSAARRDVLAGARIALDSAALAAAVRGAAACLPVLPAP